MYLEDGGEFANNCWTSGGTGYVALNLRSNGNNAFRKGPINSIVSTPPEIGDCCCCCCCCWSVATGTFVDATTSSSEWLSIWRATCACTTPPAATDDDERWWESLTGFNRTEAPVSIRVMLVTAVLQMGQVCRRDCRKQLKQQLVWLQGLKQMLVTASMQTTHCAAEEEEEEEGEGLVVGCC